MSVFIIEIFKSAFRKYKGTTSGFGPLDDIPGMLLYNFFIAVKLLGDTRTRTGIRAEHNMQPRRAAYWKRP